MRRRGIAWGIGLAVLLGLVAIARAERYAVLIGVDYQGCQSALNSQGCPPGLEGPVNDVEALQRVLVDRYQFLPEHITVLVNQNATKAKILATLAALRQTTTAHDFLLVYFSGHGTSRFDREVNLDIDSSSGVLVPDDFRFYPNDMPRTLDGLIIGKRDLRPIFAELERERRMLVIFDACFSGNTVRSLRGSAGIPRYVSLDASLLRGRRGMQVTPSVSQPTHTGTPKEPYPYKNLIYISAADETQPARDLEPQESVHGKAHGALTDVLLLGLNGAADTNHDQTITYQELYQFVRREVSDKRGHTPQLLAQTDLDQPVFDIPIRLSTPPPSPGAPTGPLQVKIEGQQEPLRSKLTTRGDIKLTDSKHDLLIAQEGSGYALYLSSGDKLCRLSTVDEVVSRITRYVRIRELAQLRNPKQVFNVWLHVGAEAGKTVFMEGERLDLSVKSERATSLLVLNIDPHGFVSAIESHVVPGAILISLAITPDGQRVLLGAEWYLRLFNRQGRALWQVPVPGTTWSVNIAPTGQVAVAALGDGTIRWYRLRDGQELLAFFPHKDQKHWVLWTPSGYYDASPGAEELIGWHVNRGRDHEADFFPVSQFRSTYYRPDVATRVLATLDEAEALRQANAEANRRQETLRIEQRLPPVVEIVTPQDGTIVSTSPVTVRVRAPADAPVTTLKALIDGRPVDQPRRVNLTAPSGDGTLHELTIPVPARDCEVSILAENRNATSTPATVRLRWQGVQEVSITQPKLYVLSIGVSRYPQATFALNFAAKDAQDVATVLRRQQSRLYREVEVQLLTDAEATRDAVLDGLEWLQRHTTNRDVAALFVAGHEVNDANGNYYFLPVNFNQERLKSTGVAFTEFKNTLAALLGKTLLFLDTCHAGNVLGGTQRTALDITGVINELASAESGVVVFAASAGQQYSLENAKWGNGAFTKALVEGLGGKADYTKTGRITVTTLDLYLAERVKELTQGQQKPVTAKPAAIGDFPLALVQ